MTDHKTYSLRQVENFLYDAMSTEATPQEIYDVIKGVVQDNYYTYKVQTEKAYELLALLNCNTDVMTTAANEKMISLGYTVENGSWQKTKENTVYDKDDPSPECKKSWNDFWEEGYTLQYTDGELNAMCDAAEKKDKVKQWVFPVQVDGLTGDCYINFAEDLLEAADLKEGDKVEWVDQGDGSFKMIKVTEKEN
jgi:hypothetical protein